MEPATTHRAAASPTGAAPPPGLPAEPVAGEHAAGIAALVHAHYRLVYAICWKVLRVSEDAEDATQEAFVKAQRNMQELREPAAAAGWLARIARNAALDLARRRTRRRRLQDEVEAHAEAHGDAVVEPTEPGRAEERERLLGAIASLPEADQVVVTLRFLEGLDPAEIATRLGDKPGTVRVRLHRALQRLRKTMGVGPDGDLDGNPGGGT